MRITKNAVRCLKCATVIESLHRHHFRTCPCGNIAVDGGLEYLRRVGSGVDDKSYVELSQHLTSNLADLSEREGV